MKEMRDLSLNCVKTNLRYLILDKTSVNVEKVQRPEFHIDRLKIAEK
jgi:propanediol utilization protein